MVLAKPLLRDNGLVLVADGTELSDALIGRLENMGVETLVVKGTPLQMEGGMDGSSFAKRMERIDHLFRKFKADPYMLKVKERLHEYFQIKAAAEAAAAAAMLAEEEGEENGADNQGDES